MCGFAEQTFRGTSGTVGVPARTRDVFVCKPLAQIPNIFLIKAVFFLPFSNSRAEEFYFNDSSIGKSYHLLQAFYSIIAVEQKHFLLSGATLGLHRPVENTCRK